MINIFPPVKKSRLSVYFLAACILTCVGGFLDAYTYLFRGGVFANAQTGNIVLLGINIFEMNWMRAIYYLVPISTFFIGIQVVEVIRTHVGNSTIVRWRSIILLAQAVFLLAVFWIPQGSYNYIVNFTVSFVCSLQLQSFSSVEGKKFASTMCTGNLRSASTHLYLFLSGAGASHLKHFTDYIKIILCFIIGAILGGFCVRVLGMYTLFIPIFIYVFIAVILLLKKQTTVKK